MKDCQHKESCKTTADGDIGTCTICGQETLYTTKGPKVTKRGSIGGESTAVHPVAAVSPPSSPPPTPPEHTTSALVPPKPKKQSKWPAYWERNKEALLQDYRSLTLLKFFQKWHLSTNKWGELKKLWGVEPKGHIIIGGKKPGPKPRVDTPQRGILLAPRVDSLPPFPPFDPSWISTVQIEWFQTYKALYLEVKKGG